MGCIFRTTGLDILMKFLKENEEFFPEIKHQQEALFFLKRILMKVCCFVHIAYFIELHRRIEVFCQKSIDF